ncbi:MAG: hypothetical protein LR015_02880 [Verrucomicrobia bacterium]|nr:hypothetical protein [Verrucomicrobiota bacterium]
MQNRAYEPRCMVKTLPIQPGSKEQRYIHTLGPVDIPQTEQDEIPQSSAHRSHSEMDRDGLAAMQEEIVSLRSELASLREEFEAFRDQFS